MKNAVKAYKSKALNILDRIEKAYRTYLPEAAQTEENRLRGEMHAARVEAEDALYSAYSDGLRRIKDWFTLDGSKLTDDVKLLEIGVTAKQFNELVEKYVGNYTMLNALHRYADRQNAQEREKAFAKRDYLTAEAYETANMPTEEAKSKAWEQVYSQAVNLLDAIDGKGRYTDPFMRTLLLSTFDETIEQLGAGFDL